MMRRTDRQDVVKAESNLVGRLPAELERWKWIALQRVKDREIPGKQVDRERWALFDHPNQELAQGERPAIVRRAAFARQFGAAVEVPADNEDALLRLPECTAQSREIRGRIDQNGRTGSFFDTPTVLAGLQDVHAIIGTEQALGSAPNTGSSEPETLRSSGCAARQGL